MVKANGIVVSRLTITSFRLSSRAQRGDSLRKPLRNRLRQYIMRFNGESIRNIDLAALFDDNRDAHGFTYASCSQRSQ